MVLRLDAVLACFCFMHRLPASFERAVAASTAAGSSPPRPLQQEKAALFGRGRTAADG
jgi:hypothetical protein